MAIEITSKWGYINRNGEIAIKPKFIMASPFSEGLACVKKGKYGILSDGLNLTGMTSYAEEKYGYIDKTGNFIIRPRYEYAENFSEDLAVVKVSGKYGYISKTGEMIIKPQFERASKFSEGLAWVGFGNFVVKGGYIDRTGKYVWNPTN
jgi:hypothetical protein